MTTIIMMMIAIVEPIRFSLAPVDGVGVLGWSGVCVGGAVVSALAVGVYCWVGAFGRGGLRESDFLFITVSRCAWRHVISLSKATKKRSKENAFNHATLSVHSVQF
ncbi:hypothetical protein [Caballeronia sp. dw_19]|uniref:hypothetical protein n=1 Tax=Caballeronia sp. dw_19 TaxID=2719791 RepID=UPI001BD4DC6B|nr:hypothetical protein [Caballeronia sp. dw_19]